MKILTLVLAVIVSVLVLAPPVKAQGGMSKATAKLLVSDLIEAGFSPTIRESGGVYFVVVTTTITQAGTASQVNSFATNRSVTAKVLTVQFE